MVSFSQVVMVGTAFLGAACAQSNSSLPIVDLGYELHQASLYNSTGGFYNFSNIRYAAPPTGEARFTPPQAPVVNRSVVDTGSVGRICPQANGAWLLTALEYIPLYLSGNQTVFNTSSFPASNASAGLPAQDPRSTEDCLFLDIVVPEAIFNARGSGYGAPVLVWIYGGGYTAGDKTGSGNPSGLLTRSESNNASGVIYVSLNYRLGAFGWLSGPTFQENGTANLGLHDQRFALEWVQQYIHLFGGDPTRVTVFGESAGGGSIMHQITAYGGKYGAPFAQAVPQSAAFQPFVSSNQQESIFNAYLELLNVSTIEEARQLPYETLQTANIIQVGVSTYGTFTYGPVVDGNFVPDLPGKLLLHGQYDHSLRLLIGHNGDEGLLFTSPFISNNSDFQNFVLQLLPTVAALPYTLEYIVNTLYPPIFDGSQAQNYTNQIGRADAAISEVSFTCNSYYLDKAFGNQTYAYLFSVPPSLHGQDVMYTYYTGAGQTQPSTAALSEGGVVAPEIAIAMQEYITHFAETGTPNEAGVPYFNHYGANATVQVLNITGISEAMDPAANYRCDYWQKALYY